jgi:hypothetical protein
VLEFTINIRLSLPKLFDSNGIKEKYLKNDVLTDFILLDLSKSIIERHNILCAAYKIIKDAGEVSPIYNKTENLLQKKPVGITNCSLKINCNVTKLDYAIMGLLGYCFKIKLLNSGENSTCNLESKPQQICEFQINPDKGSYIAKINNAEEVSDYESSNSDRPLSIQNEETDELAFSNHVRLSLKNLAVPQTYIEHALERVIIFNRYHPNLSIPLF